MLSHNINMGITFYDLSVLTLFAENDARLVF